MLLEHLYKFSSKGGFINNENHWEPRALGKCSAPKSCFIFREEYNNLVNYTFILYLVGGEEDEELMGWGKGKENQGSILPPVNSVLALLRSFMSLKQYEYSSIC